MKNASFLLDTVLTLVEHKYQVGHIKPNKTDKYLFGALTDSPCLFRIPRFFRPGFRIWDFHPNPGYGSATLNRPTKNFKHLTKQFLQRSRNMIRDVYPGSAFCYIPGPGSRGKKGLDPRSGNSVRHIAHRPARYWYIFSVMNFMDDAIVILL